MCKKKQCWHRDIILNYVTGPDQRHVICLFRMFSPTPDDGFAGDFVVASHTGLVDPWVVAPLAPLDIGDVWLGNALVVHRGGICASNKPNRPVFLVSSRLVPQGLTTPTVALLLFPLGPKKRPHPPINLRALMPLLVQMVVRSCWM